MSEMFLMNKTTVAKPLLTAVAQTLAKHDCPKVWNAVECLFLPKHVSCCYSTYTSTNTPQTHKLGISKQKMKFRNSNVYDNFLVHHQQ